MKHGTWGGQLSVIGRWLLLLSLLVWLVCLERLIGLPVLTLSLAVLWLSAMGVRGDSWVAAAVVILAIAIAALYQVQLVGVLALVLFQLFFFHRARTFLSSFTIRWWLTSWVGALGMAALSQRFLTLAVWGYPLLITAVLVLGLEVVVWWQRVRYQLQQPKLS